MIKFAPEYHILLALNSHPLMPLVIKRAISVKSGKMLTLDTYTAKSLYYRTLTHNFAQCM
jgi:hypothetical protein